MKRKLFVLMLASLLLALAAQAFADDGYYVREEASRRGMKLISTEEVRSIASKHIGASNISFKDFDLDNEAHDYPNGSDFRPVYEFECYANGREYDCKIDAVTGEILKFKLDD